METAVTGVGQGQFILRLGLSKDGDRLVEVGSRLLLNYLNHFLKMSFHLLQTFVIAALPVLLFLELPLQLFPEDLLLPAAVLCHL